MNWMIRSALFVLCCFVIGLTGMGVSQPDSRIPSTPKVSPCSASEYHQFDFWVGDWDVYDVAHPTAKIASARISRILGGCVILEDYREAGTHGESFNIYDQSRKVWHQSWVTNQGRLLVIEGNFHDDEVVLSGMDRTLDGQEMCIRGVWKAVKGGVRETAWTSMDGGKNWKLWFNIVFRPDTSEPRASASQSYP